jgi:hypothetical protein
MPGPAPKRQHRGAGGLTEKADDFLHEQTPEVKKRDEQAPTTGSLPSGQIVAI